jgi:hypothetical protein
MCPACMSTYLTTATLIAGSTGGLAAVVHRIRNKVKGESRWRFIKSYLRLNGSRPGRNC